MLSMVPKEVLRPNASSGRQRQAESEHEGQKSILPAQVDCTKGGNFAILQFCIRLQKCSSSRLKADAAAVTDRARLKLLPRELPGVDHSPASMQKKFAIHMSHEETNH